MAWNNSLPTSLAGNGLVRPGDGAVVTAKSLGIGGRVLLLFDNVDWAIGE
jgi:hypothetical protein